MKIWVRLGTTLNLDLPDTHKILSDHDGVGAEVIKRAICEGRAELDGETYLPENLVDEYNEYLGTTYESGERNWDLSFKIPANRETEKKNDWNITIERLLEILQTYVNNDLEAADPQYVRDVLTDSCGMTKEEVEECDLGYIFPDDYWD